MKKNLCPIGHKDPEKRHYHESDTGVFWHEEGVGPRQYARVMFSFHVREFPEKGVKVTDIIAINIGAMGVPMPNSYYRKHGILPVSDPERARKVGKRVEKLLLQSRMQRKIK